MIRMRIVKISDRSITATIFSSNIIIAILLLPFFKNDFFSVVPGLAIFCNIIITLEFVFLFPIWLIEDKICKFSKIILCLEIWIYVFAPLISKATVPSYYYMFQCIGAIAFFEVGFKHNYIKVLNVTTIMFTLFITLNALMLFFEIDSFVDATGVTIYLLGMRTLFSLYIIPGILFNLLRDEEVKQVSFRTILTFVAGVYALINQVVSTGLIQAFTVICLLVLLKNKKIARKINFTYVAIFLILFDVGLTVLGEQMNFLSVVTDIFGKDLTFSGRTPIWLKVVEKLKISPIAGYGNNTTVLIVNTQRNAHNQWLHTAMEGGYVAMGILILAVVVSAAQLYKRRNEKWYNVVTICTIAVLIGTITEIQTYIPFFYIVFLLPFIIPDSGDKVLIRAGKEK